MAVSSMNPSQITVKSRAGSRPVAKAVARMIVGLSAVLLMNDFSRAEATVINAADVSLLAVQTAVNSALTGDTVLVPAGTAIWANSLSINKDIQLIGAGQGLTIVTNNVPRSINSGTMFYWQTLSNGICRLSGFTFDGGAVDATNNNSSRNFYFGGTCHALRVDHCDFNGLNQGHCLEFFTWIYGVIDHCNFITPVTALMFHHDGYGGYSNGDGSWADSDQWGTTNALYVENCYFNATTYPGGVMDAVDGARVVLRYNTATNAMIGTHGTESTGRARSVRLLEVYGNTFTAQQYQNWNNQPLEVAIYLRGGTATIFSNTFVGGFKYMIKYSLYRYDPNHFMAWDNISGVNPWDSNNPTLFDSGICSTGVWTSGTSYVTVTNRNWTSNLWSGYIIYDVSQGLGVRISGNNSNTLWFSNYDPYGRDFVINTGEAYQIHKVFAAIDQVGYGQGDLLTGQTPVNTVTGTAAWPREAFDPVYEWGNVWNYSDPQSYPGAKTASDADLIARGVNWLDDVVRPGYTPLTYPHPLVVGSPTLPSGAHTPPSNLDVHP